MSKLSRSLRRLARACGYELRRVKRGGGAGSAGGGEGGAGVSEDLAALLHGHDVRVVLDVGANVGHTAKEYRRLFPRAVVHAFEPFAETADQLTARVAGDASVRVHRTAVSDRVGTARFHANNSSATSSLLATAGEAGRHVDPELSREVAVVEVPTTTLEAFCREQDIDRVDLLKLDIQGGERLAIEGGRALLEQGRVDVIVSEVLFAPLYEGQASFEELRASLEAMGYALYGLYELTRGRSGVLAWGDAIFVGPRMRAGR